MAWLIFGGVALLLAAGLIWNARRTQRKANILGRAAPVTAESIRHSFPGEMVSIAGTSRSEQELLSQHAGEPCIYFESSIIREYQRRRSSRRGGRSRGSETVESFTRSVPFSVEDQTGQVQVDPEGAEFDARETMNRYVPNEDRQGAFSLGGISINIGNREQTLGHRYVEKTISVDSPVFVLGVVDEGGSIRTPDAGRSNAGFFISYRDEKSLKRAWQESARRQIYGAFASAAVGAGLLVYWIFENAPF